ncbi:hypothetical protein Ddc_18338 [Ditylenchus destructor]|nr:hypothetical protein Ddc_18338 [Ditylenchus destructor]
MFLPSEVLSEVFSSISRQQLADLQLVNRQFDSIIDAKVYPFHVVDVVYISWNYDTNKGLFDLVSENNGLHSIDLDSPAGSAPIPSYLRFLYIKLYDMTFTPCFIDQLTRYENAFDGGELTFHLYTVPCKNEHELRLQTLEIIEKMTPVFHKVRDIRLVWSHCYEFHYYGNIAVPVEDDINILSTPLLLNCRSLLLDATRMLTDRLALVSPNQVVDWLFPDKEGDKEGRYLVLFVNRDPEDILKDLISKKVESMNERRCEVIVENRDPMDLISERAKSMLERPGDVVVEFPKGDPGRIYKYPRGIFDK